MAVISSLIDLQIDYFDYENPKDLLRDMRNRIKSISLVHELVYENKNFIEIDFGKLLCKLVEHVKKIHHQDNKEISFVIRADGVIMDINNSIPLSLLANELISNSCKHAFTKHKNGCIEMILEKKNDGYLMIVQDDGIGIADTGLLYNPDTLGYTIIHGLVQQLNGKLAFQPQEKGLRVELRFPKMNKPLL